MIRKAAGIFLQNVCLKQKKLGPFKMSTNAKQETKFFYVINCNHISFVAYFVI